VVPLGYRTDGHRIWSEATTYYLATYGLGPDPGLLAQVAVRPFGENPAVTTDSAGG
jgi:hypothetical protein